MVKKKAAIFGASSALAAELARKLVKNQWEVDLIGRSRSYDTLCNELNGISSTKVAHFFAVKDAYSSFDFCYGYDAIFQAQAIFEPRAIVNMNPADIAAEINVGLTEQVIVTHKFLHAYPSFPGKKRDICFIGSTSSYAGFKNTTVYCAVKHGLLGFVRAMNDEYAQSEDRFWLFSMGTMNTAMGHRVVGQDPSTFLQPADVAERIVDAITTKSNIFEPEMIIRRRTVKFLEK